jgi:hypothetical protein
MRLMFASTNILGFLIAFPNRKNQRSNHKARKEDTNETDKEGHQSSEWGFDNDIAVTDRQSRNEGKVQRVSKGHLLNKRQRSSAGHYQRDLQQNYDLDMPDDTKEVLCKSGKHNHLLSLLHCFCNLFAIGRYKTT